MTKPDNVIKLLLIEDSADEAEQIISMLRNGGIAVRPSRAGNEAELDDLLERQTPDLILANLGSRDLPLAPGRRSREPHRQGHRPDRLRRANRTMRPWSRRFAMARAHWPCSDRADHLQMIVRREFEALTTRRSVRRLENALARIRAPLQRPARFLARSDRLCA